MIESYFLGLYGNKQVHHCCLQRPKILLRLVTAVEIRQGVLCVLHLQSILSVLTSSLRFELQYVTIIMINKSMELIYIYRSNVCFDEGVWSLCIIFMDSSGQESCWNIFKCNAIKGRVVCKELYRSRKAHFLERYVCSYLHRGGYVFTHVREVVCRSDDTKTAERFSIKLGWRKGLSLE